jgi:glycyl-tRNA synthetase alpha subunit
MAASFQAMISALQAFWEEQGCVIVQPYHTELGAGTSNPATLLRVLGGEPWRGTSSPRSGPMTAATPRTRTGSRSTTSTRSS